MATGRITGLRPSDGAAISTTSRCCHRRQPRGTHGQQAGAGRQGIRTRKLPRVQARGAFRGWEENRSRFVHLTARAAEPSSGQQDATASAATEKPDFSSSRPLFENGTFANWTPSTPGVYAVYDKDQNLQYVGLSRKVSTSIDRHAESLGEAEMSSVQVVSMPGATKEDLQAMWTEWIQDHINREGDIPSGNKPGQGKWSLKRTPPKSDLKLTPGKGIEDLTIPLEKLIDGLVKSTKVVAFIKGTRTQPECGFSHQVLTLLNKSKVDYETVNVLDTQYNPGVRDAIKEYSNWPTIPQVYVGGEFIGGADILIEMDTKGELAQALQGEM